MVLYSHCAWAHPSRADEPGRAELAVYVEHALAHTSCDSCGAPREGAPTSYGASGTAWGVFAPINLGGKTSVIVLLCPGCISRARRANARARGEDPDEVERQLRVSSGAMPVGIIGLAHE